MADDLSDLKNEPYIDFDLNLNVKRTLNVTDKQKKENVITDLVQQNLPPDNDKFYTEYDPGTDRCKVKEDPDQTEKDEKGSKIADTDKKLEQYLSERDRKNARKIRKKKFKKAKRRRETKLVAALER